VLYTNPTAAATAPACPQVGLAARTDIATSASPIVAADTAAGEVVYAAATAAAVTVPTPTTLANANPIFATDNNLTAGAVTFTPTTLTVNGGATLVMNQKQHCIWMINPAAATDWFAPCVDRAGYFNGVQLTPAAGQILAGATPAYTATPALGTDNSVAGTLTLANGSAAAHTIWASGATTTNTIAGFATAPTTGHMVTCTVSATTCTLTDGGAPGAGTVTSIATTSPITGGTITATGTIACATCTTAASALTSNIIAKGGGSQALGLSSITDNGTTISTAEPIAITADGVHPGIVSLPGNTTLPSLPANTASIIGSPAATQTSWSLQLPTAIPATTDLFSCVVTSTNCVLTDSGVPNTAAGFLAKCSGCAPLASPSLTTPNIGAATGTSLLATGLVDGTAPVIVTTGATGTPGATYNHSYSFNEEATAGTGVNYTLPTAAAGKQYCAANAYNGSAANTGVITITTSASGQFIIFTDGTLSATGGNITSGGAAGDAACVVGVDATHWYLYVQAGTWTKY
jgi:hypothetical protein